MMDYYQIMVYHGRNTLITWRELLEITGISQDSLQYYLDYGLIEPAEPKAKYLLFDISAIPRIRMIQRLRTEVGINLSGIAIILDLRDKIEKLQRDLEWFKNL